MKTLKALAALVVMGLLGVVVFQFVEIRRLKSELDETGREMRIREFIWRIHMPAEVLYYDSGTMKQIAELRLASYRQLGVERIMRYSSCIVLDQRPPSFVPVKDWSDMVNWASFENYWLNRWNDAVRQLALDIELNQPGLGTYFREHPEVFRQRVRPYLIRRLQARYTSVRLGAAESLLAVEGPSPEVIACLGRFVRHRPGDPIDARWFPMGVSSRDRAVALCDQYDLNIKPVAPGYYRRK